LKEAVPESQLDVFCKGIVRQTYYARYVIIIPKRQLKK